MKMMVPCPECLKKGKKSYDYKVITRKKKGSSNTFARVVECKKCGTRIGPGIPKG